ncbi:MAG: phage tail protein [Thiobacillus sp.]|nr:phage tail protein [Thiobacillus sp.]
MSSTGQIVGGVVGAVVGFYTGVGPVYGAQIGMMIGGAIDPPEGPVINGPRLDDLSVQTSTYGAFIPRNYGTIAQNGNIFWLKGDALTETPRAEESGGKGGPTSTTNLWDYSATFALGLSDCSDGTPIDGVRRIWINGQLFYDAGSIDVSTIIASNEASEFFTLYTGTDTQLPDPLIQADKGASNVPAYRGLAYIVFESLPLAKYNNSLAGAQIKVEIVKNGVISHSLTQLGEVLTGGGSFPVGIDVVGNYAYVVTQTTEWLYIYDIHDVTNPHLVGSVRTGFICFSVKVHNGYAYVINYGTGNLQIFNVANPYSPTLVGSVVTGANPRAIDVVWPYAYIITGTDKLQIYDVRIVVAPVMVGSVSTGVNPRGVVVSGDYAYVTNYTSNTLQIFSILSPFSPALAGSIATSSAPYGIDIKDNHVYVTHAMSADLKVYDVSVAAAPTLAGTATISTAAFDVSISGDFCYVMNTGGIIDAFDISSPTSPALLASTSFGSNCYSGIGVGSYVFFVDAYIDVFRTVLFAPNRLTSDAVPLSSIVESECLSSSLLTAGDLDVTELTDSVRGYRIASLGALRGGIEPLRAAWPFDVVQHGYKLLFKRRGSSSVATITEDEVDARAAGDNPGVRITNSREMDTLLPSSLHLKYLDVVREYDTNEQPSYKGDGSGHVVTVDIPVVLNADEASQAVAALHDLYWLERFDLSFVLPPTYSQLEPADVVTVPASYATFELRLTGTNTLPDGRIECRAKYNNAALYVQVASGEEGQSVGATLTLAGPSVYQLLDIPLMRDDDDTAGFPVAMSGYLSGWPGGVLYRSDDSGATWADLKAFAPGQVMGYATTSLAAHGGTLLDKASTLSVRLYSGTLASVTEAQMFAGQNWFAYGADGRWEIVAAQNATLQGDGSYVLTDFMRGQRGTEWASGLHVANDRIVKLNATTLEFISVNTSTIGAPRSYRAITTGKGIDSDASLSFTYAGVNLECLSPVNLTGNRHPSTNDWTLLWTRRSRFDGWRDYVDAALGESSESYEVDVYSNGTYTTLKRTLTSATQTVAYTSANQVTDFGSNQSTLYIKVYQLSATVGRGYPLTTSITRT